MLNLKVEYSTTNLPYAEISADVEKLVQSSQPVDVYINDICALTRCMFQGYFTNLLNFGKNTDGSDVQNFFDFSYDGWYADYMAGLTLDSSKQYIMAGDYFVDLIRFAWVLFVNVTEYDATFSELTDWKNYDYTARRIDFAGEWTYDDLAFLSGKAHIDSANKGTTDLEDSRVGLLFATMSTRIASWTTGLSIVEWEDGVIGKGMPKIVGEAGTDPATKNQLSNLSVEYGDLYRATGVFNTALNKDCVDYFIDGKAVFSTVVLGEMESESMRDVKFTRGVLPFPKYSDAQEEFHTLVHDQAEVGVILKNAQSPTMASAYMQAVNEASSDVLSEYYENSLKVKYNTAGDSEGGVRLMIDLVHDTVDSPFESLIVGNYLYWYANGGISKVAAYYHMGVDAKNNSTDFSTNYDASIPALAAYLKTMCDTFAQHD